MTDATDAGHDFDGRRDRWTAHRVRRRRQFVDAAVRVLAEQGPELTMDAVAVQAGVTKPVLYRYFHDKAELVHALDARGTELLFARLLPAIAADGPARPRVRAAVDAYFSVIDENPNLYWLIARQPALEGSAGAGAVDEHKEFIAAALGAVIADYLRRYHLDTAGAEPWAHGMTGLVQSTGEWWLRTRLVSRDRVVDDVTQLVWAGLSGVLREAGVIVHPDRPFSSGTKPRGAK